jgi:hypothetical protein
MDLDCLAKYLEKLYANTLSDCSFGHIGHVYIIVEALLDVETRDCCVQAVYNSMQKPVQMILVQQRMVPTCALLH